MPIFSLQLYHTKQRSQTAARLTMKPQPRPLPFAAAKQRWQPAG